jgi:hypothetical protein
MRVCCANIQPASKLLVTMDSTSSVMIPSLTHSIINTSHPTCFSFTILSLCIVYDFSCKSWVFSLWESSIAISYVVNLFNQYCRVSFVFSHGLKPVGVFHELVCRVIIPLAVILSSLEFFLVMLNCFLRPISLAPHSCRSALPPRLNFLSCFPTATSLPLSFITISTYFCA